MSLVPAPKAIAQSWAQSMDAMLCLDNLGTVQIHTLSQIYFGLQQDTSSQHVLSMSHYH